MARGWRRKNSFCRPKDIAVEIIRSKDNAFLGTSGTYGGPHPSSGIDVRDLSVKLSYAVDVSTSVVC